jgi:hypothetical protein
VKYPLNTTYPACDKKTEERYRNQATGIGSTRAASERTGRNRAEAVINAAPAAQRACADDSYPAPTMPAPGSTEIDKPALYPFVTASVQGRIL